MAAEHVITIVAIGGTGGPSPHIFTVVAVIASYGRGLQGPLHQIRCMRRQPIVTARTANQAGSLRYLD